MSVVSVADAGDDDCEVVGGGGREDTHTHAYVMAFGMYHIYQTAKDKHKRHQCLGCPSFWFCERGQRDTP